MENIDPQRLFVTMRVTKKSPKNTQTAVPLEARRITKGPEPERLKISGVKNWEDAVTLAMKKKKPASGWPK
jgi:hypothetical protein